MPECQNCGHQVTQRYARVFVPEGVDAPRCCPECEDRVRRNGIPQPARASRHSGNAAYDDGESGEVAKHGEGGWSR